MAGGSPDGVGIVIVDGISVDDVIMVSFPVPSKADFHMTSPSSDTSERRCMRTVSGKGEGEATCPFRCAGWDDHINDCVVARHANVSFSLHFLIA